MRRILILLSLSFVVMLFASPVFANEGTKQDKVYLYFEYPDSQKVKQVILESYVLPVLAKNNCDVITDRSFFAKLQSKGYADSISAERADIIDAYKDDDFRYLIFMDMDELQPGSGYSFVYTKIIDMRTHKYIYSGRIYQATKGGGHGTLIKMIGKEIARVLKDKVFVFTPGQANIK
jgi:hypothetical protein